MARKFSNYIFIFRMVGVIMIIIALAMIIPWLYSIGVRDINGSRAFGLCCPATLILGMCLFFFARYKGAPSPRFGSRDAYIIVSASWFIASIIGAFPYYLSGCCDSSFIDAFFESTSGFTTTGCTAIAGDGVGRTLLLWKAISNWLGGMGILVFVISILPALGISGLAIVSAEAPGPVMQKTTVRTSDTAKTLYVTYFLFTILEFIALSLTRKMPLYDIVITTLGNVSTGGLVVHAEGIAFYNSLAVNVIIAVVCILSSINYSLYFYAVTGRPSVLISDIETRVFLCILAGGTILCTGGLMSANHVPFFKALTDSAFQVISCSTTAGYTLSADVVWPVASQMVLLTVIFIGGCAASTSGSAKVIRIIVAAKLIVRGGIRRIHPRSVVAVRVGDTAISAPVVSYITVFLMTFISITLGSSILLSLQGMSLESSLTTSLSLISNTGIPFNHGMLSGDFGFYHPLLKLWLCLLMIMGRLEIFTILILFSPRFWGKRQ